LAHRTNVKLCSGNKIVANIVVVLTVVVVAVVVVAVVDEDQRGPRYAECAAN